MALAPSKETSCGDRRSTANGPGGTSLVAGDSFPCGNANSLDVSARPIRSVSKNATGAPSASVMTIRRVSVAAFIACGETGIARWAGPIPSSARRISASSTGSGWTEGEVPTSIRVRGALLQPAFLGGEFVPARSRRYRGDL